MRIDQISIKNFKGFKEQTFQLNPHFTVFIGDNGSGKTSVLDALSVAMGSFLLGIDHEKVKSRLIASNEIHSITIAGQPRPQKPVCIQADGFLQDQAISWKREIVKQKTTTKDTYPISEQAYNILIESRKPLDKRAFNVIFPLLAYHGTGRLWAEHQKVSFQKQEEGVEMAYTNCLSAKSSSKEFLSWYKTQEEQIRNFDQALDKAHLQAVKNIILELVPNHQWEDIAFDRKADDLMGIFTDNNGEKNKLAYSQLSDGFKTVVGLAADLAYRCIQLNPHLGVDAVKETPGIVLIDELDLHLHPNWQRRIVADLKRTFPKVQFVATTHSPFIVQSLMKEELVILDQLDEQNDLLEEDPINTSIEDTSEEYMGVEVPQRSKPFEERVKVATEYYQLIRESKNGEHKERINELQQRLNELEAKFGEDPTFVAHLIAERKINQL